VLIRARNAEFHITFKSVGKSKKKFPANNKNTLAPLVCSVLRCIQFRTRLSSGAQSSIFMTEKIKIFIDEKNVLIIKIALYFFAEL